jgi:hypothetical protein
MAGIRDDITIPVVDDTGTGRDGTPADEAWVDQLLDAIDAWVYSPANPTVQPNDITDEVVTARAAYPNLDARLDDLALASSVATNVTAGQMLGGLGGVNLVTVDDFLLWPDGDAAAPDTWTLAGAGATIARAGTGLGDTNRKIGDFCAKITRAGTDVTLTKTLLTGSAFTRADYLKQQYACGGAWVKCSTPNVARVAIFDGVGTTTSAYHTGGGAFEFLPVTRQINIAATALAIIPQVNNSNVAAYFSGATLLILDSSQTLTRYVECPVQYGTMHFAVGGTIAVSTNVGREGPARSGIVKDVQCHLKTAPTGQAAIFDVNSWDGAALTSMFSTRPQIAAAANDGGAQPDTTYARRCLRGFSGSSRPVGGLVTVDIDQVGSGVAGADVHVDVRVMQYVSPLERYQTT